MERVISLDGEWLLGVDPENAGREQQWWRGPRPEARTTRVPWIIQGPFPGYHGVAWYWRRLTVPEPCCPGGRYLLRFHAVDYLAEVWVGGAHVGGHEGGETPFTLDVTAAVEAGREDVLAVRVLNPTNEPIDGICLAETPHRNKVIPYRTGGSFGYGGILESVELVLAPPVRIADLYARADLGTGRVRARVALRNDQSAAVAGRLQVTVGPAAAGEALEQVARPVTCPPGEGEVEVQVPLAGPRPWELADPFLYRVTARLETDDPRAAHERSVRCGFRDFRVEGGYFRLNGRRLFVRSTHTGNHSPLGQVLAPPAAPDLLRRDLLFAKASGYNMVRFIAGIAHPEQLDLADEIGLLVYEESLAGWCLGDSPHMAERFDFSLREMVLRDRNHPSVVVWGLLNETQDTPVFRQARDSLPLLRSLDDSRLVLLSSGRWDGQWGTGSVCNPGSAAWEPAWGAEEEGAAPCPTEGTFIPAYKTGAGDAHMYPSVPQTDEVEDFIRAVGRDTRPVFVSEYGIGSLMNAVRELRHYEQAGADPQAEDAALMRHMAESLERDWGRYGFAGVYPFAEDMLRHSQERHARHRLLTFDLIRANPAICGYNVTGMLDHGMTGEGLWTFWREWKPGALDALADGWAPVRWCLFARPRHGYADQPLTVEAVLANEDVVRPGTYPVVLRLLGPGGIAWERRVDLAVTGPERDREPPLALPVLKEDVAVAGPPGPYELAASMAGAAPAGGRIRVYRSADVGPLRLKAAVTLWGVPEAAAEWLRGHGVEGRALAEGASAHREVILVGGGRETGRDLAGWREVMERVDRGAVA
ncbi:MAG: sugar-binding domain-containing protein, partial [Gemmatimonadota bacterium]